MNNLDAAREILSQISEQMTAERLSDYRALAGLDALPEGALAQLFEEQPFSIEDVVTALLASHILHAEENKTQAKRIAELEDTCEKQVEMLDRVANQALRLRALLERVSPDLTPVSPMDRLKRLAADAAGPKPDA